MSKLLKNVCLFMSTLLSGIISHDMRITTSLVFVCLSIWLLVKSCFIFNFISIVSIALLILLRPSWIVKEKLKILSTGNNLLVLQKNVKIDVHIHYYFRLSKSTWRNFSQTRTLLFNLNNGKTAEWGTFKILQHEMWFCFDFHCRCLCSPK